MVFCLLCAITVLIFDTNQKDEGLFAAFCLDDIFYHYIYYSKRNDA